MCSQQRQKPMLLLLLFWQGFFNCRRRRRCTSINFANTVPLSHTHHTRTALAHTEPRSNTLSVCLCSSHSQSIASSYIPYICMFRFDLLRVLRSRSRRCCRNKRNSTTTTKKKLIFDLSMIRHLWCRDKQLKPKDKKINKKILSWFVGIRSIHTNKLRHTNDRYECWMWQNNQINPTNHPVLCWFSFILSSIFSLILNFSAVFFVVCSFPSTRIRRQLLLHHTYYIWVSFKFCTKFRFLFLLFFCCLFCLRLILIFLRPRYYNRFWLMLMQRTTQQRQREQQIHVTREVMIVYVVCAVCRYCVDWMDGYDFGNGSHLLYFHVQYY